MSPINEFLTAYDLMKQLKDLNPMFEKPIIEEEDEEQIPYELIY